MLCQLWEIGILLLIKGGQGGAKVPAKAAWLSWRKPLYTCCTVIKIWQSQAFGACPQRYLWCIENTKNEYPVAVHILFAPQTAHAVPLQTCAILSIQS